MPNLTVRNLTSTPLRITHTSRFPTAKPSVPKPITKDNITDVGNIVRNVTHKVGSVFRRPPVTKIFPQLQQHPSSEQIAENAKAFEEENVSVEIGTYSAKDTGFKLDDSTLRLEFDVTEGSGPAKKFRVDVAPAGGRLELQVYPKGDVGGTSLVGVFHKNRNNLAIVSNASLTSWMGSLPDGTPLGALSMPGTHNSPTCYTALPSVRCQAVGIPEQLQNGIRFFDLRVQPDDGGGKDLTLVHGVFPISLSGPKQLSDALADFYKFLDANKKEVLVISLKREGRGKTTDEAFSKLIAEEVVGKSNAHWFVEPLIPTLGQARGRCVLFRRYTLHPDLKKEHGGKGYGINAESWAYNTPNFTTPSKICVQDFCEVMETENIDKKIEYVKEHLERCCTQLATSERERTEPPLFVNFLSASNFWKVGCWPDRIAAKINPAICEYLAVDHKVANGNADTGIVIYDFVGDDRNWAVCRLVVGMNGALLV